MKRVLPQRHKDTKRGRGSGIRKQEIEIRKNINVFYAIYVSKFSTAKSFTIFNFYLVKF